MTVLVACMLLLISQAPVAQACPGCRATPTDTLLTFSPLFVQNKGLLASYTLLATDLTPLDPTLYEVIQPAIVVGAALVSAPTYRINQGTSFTLRIDGRMLAIPQPLEITLVETGRTHAIRLEQLNQGFDSNFLFDAPTHALSLTAKSVRNVQFRETVEELGISYAFSGLMRNISGIDGVFMRVFAVPQRVVFRENHGNASRWNLSLTRSTRKGSTTYEAMNILVPRGGRLLVNYSTWINASGRPVLVKQGFGTNSARTPVPVKRD